MHEFTIGDRLRKAREAAGYDQRGFEAASGISRATISAYELGKSTPRRAFLSIWANVTRTSLGWLLDGQVTHSSSDTATGCEDNDQATVTASDAELSGNTGNTSGHHRNPAQAHPAEGPSIAPK